MNSFIETMHVEVPFFCCCICVPRGCNFVQLYGFLHVRRRNTSRYRHDFATCEYRLCRHTCRVNVDRVGRVVCGGCIIPMISLIKILILPLSFLIKAIERFGDLLLTASKYIEKKVNENTL